MGEDGRTLVTKNSFRLLQTLYNLGPAPEPNMTVFWSDEAPARASRSSARKVSIDTSAIQYESDAHITSVVRRRRAPSRAACPPMRGRQADAVLRRAGQPRQDPALRHQRRPRRGVRQAGRAGLRAGRRATSWTTTTSCAKFDATDGLAGADLRRRAQRASTSCTTSTPTSASRWRCTTARSCAPWRAASPGSRSWPTRCRRSSTPRSTRCATSRGLVVDYTIEGDYPTYGNDDDRGRRDRRRPGPHVHGEGPHAADLPRRGAHPVGADDHVERRLRQGHRQHPRRPPRRASRSRRVPTR